MPPRPHSIYIRANPDVVRQWREALALFRAVNKLTHKQDGANRLLRRVLAVVRSDLKRKLGPNWREALAEVQRKLPPEMPDRGKLEPPPMVD